MADVRYFVRSVAADNDTLHIVGDTNQTTQILIAAPMRFKGFTWNNVSIPAVQGLNLLWATTLPGPPQRNSIAAPSITEWKWRDSLPEISGTYDDSAWVTADRQSSTNPNQPYANYTGKYMLYLPEYGFAVGNTILRGSFTGTGQETGFAASVSAGTGGAAAFWVSSSWILPGVR